MLFFLLLISCKDNSSTHVAGEEETCKLYMDQRNWGAAITVCKDISTDSGRHLTAEAYMERAGLSAMAVMQELMKDENSGNTSNVIFGFIPDAADDAADYQLALTYLDAMTVKNQGTYFETILISSLLIFKQLKTLLSLSINSNGEFVTCSMDPSSDSSCSFLPTLLESQVTPTVEVPEKLTFAGLGKGFYNGVCGTANDATHDTAFTVDVTSDEDDPASTTTPKEKIVVTVKTDFTVDNCSIQNGSPLYHNKTAFENFTGISGISGLDNLNFYSKMDTGENFSFEVVEATGDSPAQDLTFCNNGFIALPEASDSKLNDCEIMGMFSDDPTEIF